MPFQLAWAGRRRLTNHAPPCPARLPRTPPRSVINCAPDAAAAERRLRAANDRKWAVFALFLVKKPEALFQITLMDLGTLEPLIEPPNEDLWEYVVRQTKFTPQQVGAGGRWQRLGWDNFKGEGRVAMARLWGVGLPARLALWWFRAKGFWAELLVLRHIHAVSHTCTLMCTHTRARTHTHTHTRTHTHTHTPTHTHTHPHTHTSMHTQSHAHTCTHAHMQTHSRHRSQGAITDCLAEMLCARSAAIQSELESLTRDQPDAHDVEAGELVLQRAEGLKVRGSERVCVCVCVCVCVRARARSPQYECCRAQR
jgi:hypothetical protein